MKLILAQLAKYTTVLLCLLLVLFILPQTASAAAPSDGGFMILDITRGDITITKDNYTFEGVQYPADPDGYVIYGKTEESRTIKIYDAGAVKITFVDLWITDPAGDATSTGFLDIRGTENVGSQVELNLSGTNVIQSNQDTASEIYAVQMNSSDSLTISGSGSLKLHGPSNFYRGGAAVKGGSLTINNGAVSLIGGNVVSGPFGMAFQGDNLTVNGGTLNCQAGTILTPGAGNVIISGEVNVGANGTLNVGYVLFEDSVQNGQINTSGTLNATGTLNGTVNVNAGSVSVVHETMQPAFTNMPNLSNSKNWKVTAGSSAVPYNEVNTDTFTHNHSVKIAECTAHEIDYTATVTKVDDATHKGTCKWCGYAEVTQAHADHYTYSSEDNKVTATCACGHSLTAKLQLKTGENLTYTGSKIEPMEMVYPTGWPGTTNQPAENDYSNNIDAGTATCTYAYASGVTVTNTFTIAKAQLSACTTQTINSGIYTGSKQTPEIELEYNNVPLTPNADYTISEESGDFKNAGDHIVKLAGNGNYTGEITLIYTINKANPAPNHFVVNGNTAIFDGSEHSVTVGYDTALSYMGRITVSYTDSEDQPVVSPANAGEYNILVSVDDTGRNFYATTVPIRVGTLTINKARPTITIAPNQTVTYDGNPVTAGTSGADIIYVYSGDGEVTVKWYDKDGNAVNADAANPFVPKDAGTYKIGVLAAAGTNYNAAAEVKQTITINPRDITVKASDAGKTYGDADPTLTYAVTSDVKLVDGDTLRITLSRAEGENVGTYWITASQTEGANPNYNITFERGTLTINKAPLTIIVEDREITYGEELQGVLVNGTGFKFNDDHIGLGQENVVFPSTYSRYDDVGTYSVTSSGWTSDNYEISYTPGILTVKPKPITVTIENKTGAYGEEIVALTASTTEGAIVNNDTDVYTLATTATKTSNVGTYEITGQELDGNYDITFVNGSYTITPAIAEVATAPVAVENLVYDGSEQTLIVAGVTNDGTMQYSLEQNGTYFPELPQASAAGTYKVWYTVLGDSNHADSEIAFVECKIAQINPKIGAVTAGIVNNTLETSSIVLSREDDTVAGTLTVDAGQKLVLGNNEIAYTFNPRDTTNYKPVTGKVTVMVADTIAPTGKVTVSNKSWSEFLNKISFGLFFKETQIISVEASDNLSGVAMIEYLESKTALELAEIKKLANDKWTEMKNGKVSVALEDAKQFVYYVRVSDKSGNIAYLSSDGAEFDTTAPVIGGVDNAKTYYTTQKVAVADKNLDTVTLNGKAADSAIVLDGNKEAAYTIVATDKAGNSTTVTVKMAPIADLTAGMEKKDSTNVTSADKANLQTIVDVTTELLKDTDLTAAEKTELEKAKADAEALITVVNKALAVVDTDNTEKVEAVTADNVKLEDKTNLEKAKADLEKVLKDNAGNYTDAETQAIKTELERIEAALKAIENVEALVAMVAKLPASVEPDEEEIVAKVEEAKKAYDALTAYEKSLVDKDTKSALDKLVMAIAAYEIVKGDGSSWMRDTNKGLEFTVNGSVNKFVGIEVDGKLVDKENYTVKAGSTILELKASYLNKLSSGKHTLTVLYTNGETEGTFKIVAKTDVPGTGDDSNLLLWAGILCLSVAAIALIIGFRKKFMYKAKYMKH